MEEKTQEVSEVKTAVTPDEVARSMLFMNNKVVKMQNALNARDEILKKLEQFLIIENIFDSPAQNNNPEKLEEMIHQRELLIIELSEMVKKLKSTKPEKQEEKK